MSRNYVGKYDMTCKAELHIADDYGDNRDVKFNGCYGVKS